MALSFVLLLIAILLSQPLPLFTQQALGNASVDWSGGLEVPPCLSGVLGVVTSWLSEHIFKEINEERLAELVNNVGLLANDPRCGSTDSCKSSSTIMLWMQNPAWFNGVLAEHAVRMRQNGSVENDHFYAVHQLASPSTLVDAARMHEAMEANVLSKHYGMFTSDASASSLEEILQDDSRLAHLPENSCINLGDPSGPLSPRTFLLMWYRRDALTALKEEEEAAAVGPAGSGEGGESAASGSGDSFLGAGWTEAPDDWEGLLALLAAHRRARARREQQQAKAGGLQLLPRYGLCLTSNPHCGRVGDVLAAIAASVVQTRGTSQGYVFDLGVPPPAAVPLVNGTGWRYAAGLLRQLLSYNAPPDATPDLALAASKGVPYDCHAVSPLFTTGDCLVTMEWDAALPYMAAAPALVAPGVLGVAPLPGSRLVVDHNARRTSGLDEDASTAGGGRLPLVPCSARACAISVNHELLYSVKGVYSHGAVPPESVLDTDHSSTGGPEEAGVNPLEWFAELEAAEVEAEAEAVNRSLAQAPQQLVNRAPYSAFYGVKLTLTVQGVSSSLINGSHTMNDIGAERLMALREARQALLNAVRAGMGFVVRLASHEQDCAGYARTKWWAALWAAQPPTHDPSRRRGLQHHNRLQRRRQRELQHAVDSLELEAATSAELSLQHVFNGSLLAKQLGVDVQTAAAYARTLWFCVHHPNGAPDVASRADVNWFRWGLGYAAAALVPNTSSSPSLSALTDAASEPKTAGPRTAVATKSEPAVYSAPAGAADAAAVGDAGLSPSVGAAIELLTRVFHDAVTLRGAASTRSGYEKSISAGEWDLNKHATAGDATPRGDDGGSSLTHGQLVVVILVPQIVVILVVAAVLLVVQRRRRNRARHRDLLGRVRAPRVGPDTTLLITDVQNSTGLWEALSVDTMDAALQIHHATIRRELAQHDGYESATEGDSFIVAFACPAAATAFAVSCQLALLEQDWPQELLEHPDGALMLVDPRDGHGEGPSAGAQGLGLAALGLGGGSRGGGPGSGVPSEQGRKRMLTALLSSNAHTVSLPLSLHPPFVGPPSATYSRPPRPWSFKGPGLFTGLNTAGSSSAGGHGSSCGLILDRGVGTAGGSRGDGDGDGGLGGGVSDGAPLPAVLQLSTVAVSSVRLLESPTTAVTSGPHGRHQQLSSPLQQPQPPQLSFAMGDTSNNSRRQLQYGDALPLPLLSDGATVAPSTTTAGPAVALSDAAVATAAEAATVEAVASSPEVRYDISELEASGGVGPLRRPPPVARCTSGPQPCRRRVSASAYAAPQMPLMPTYAAAGSKAGNVCTATCTTEANGFTRTAQSAPQQPALDGCGPESLDEQGMCSGADSFVVKSGTGASGSGSGDTAGSGGVPWRQLLTSMFPVVQTPPMETELLVQEWCRQRGKGGLRPLPDGRIVVFRGLRVRMGLHAGLEDPRHISFNKVASSYQYGGDFAETARLVSDTAPGGLVVMSASTFTRLRTAVECGGSHGKFVGKEAVVVYGGHHVLKSSGTGGGGNIGGGAGPLARQLFLESPEPVQPITTELPLPAPTPLDDAYLFDPEEPVGPSAMLSSDGLLSTAAPRAVCASVGACSESEDGRGRDVCDRSRGGGDGGAVAADLMTALSPSPRPSPTSTGLPHVDSPLVSCLPEVFGTREGRRASVDRPQGGGSVTLSLPAPMAVAAASPVSPRCHGFDQIIGLGVDPLSDHSVERVADRYIDQVNDPNVGVDLAAAACASCARGRPVLQPDDDELESPFMCNAAVLKAQRPSPSHMARPPSAPLPLTQQLSGMAGPLSTPQHQQQRRTPTEDPTPVQSVDEQQEQQSPNSRQLLHHHLHLHHQVAEPIRMPPPLGGQSGETVEVASCLQQDGSLELACHPQSAPSMSPRHVTFGAVQRSFGATVAATDLGYVTVSCGAAAEAQLQAGAGRGAREGALRSPRLAGAAVGVAAATAAAAGSMYRCGQPRRTTADLLSAVRPPAAYTTALDGDTTSVIGAPQLDLTLQPSASAPRVIRERNSEQRATPAARSWFNRHFMASTWRHLRISNSDPAAKAAAHAAGDVTRHFTPCHLPQPLYIAVPSGLLCRLALCAPLRSRWVAQVSSLDAPTGLVTVAFLKVVGAATLLAELPGPAAAALDQCQQLVCGLLGSAGGYLVEGCGDGLVLAAFSSPAVAVEWALDCVEGLKRLDWDPELLSHELCAEQLDLGVNTSAGSFRRTANGPRRAAIAAMTNAEPAAGGGADMAPRSAPLATHDALLPRPNPSAFFLSPLNHRSPLSPRGHLSPMGHFVPDITTTITPAAGSKAHVDRATGPGAGAPGKMGAAAGRPAAAAVTAAAVAAPTISQEPASEGAWRHGFAKSTTTSLNRGLRIKVGLATGVATHSVNATSGRLSYRGKLMNRASRIAGVAAAGQVLCSSTVWSCCETADATFCNRVMGVSMGPVSLKGVRGPLQLVQCIKESDENDADEEEGEEEPDS